jgi:hypothetical protein
MQTPIRHCERSEAIQALKDWIASSLIAPRNDAGEGFFHRSRRAAIAVSNNAA